MVSGTVAGVMAANVSAGRAARLGVYAAICVVLSACAQTETVRPVAMSQQGDESLTCEQLDVQIHKNQAAAVEFAKRARAVESDNDAYKVASIFVTLAAVGVDLTREDQIEARSLRDRNEYLLYLRGQKKC